MKATVCALTDPADLSDVEFSLQTIDYLVIKTIATLGDRAPAERAWVIDTHQEDGHLSA